MKKALIACEYSGTVRDALSEYGWYAVSCDILPSDTPGNHYQGDVRDILYDDWDLLIAFPPCTHLAVSGARHFKEKIRDGRQKEGIDFFMLFANHPCKKVSIENPVGIMSSLYRKPDQIIQPYEYGHPESKKTCLWLKGLPLLRPTNILSIPECGHWENQTPSGQNKIMIEGKWIAFSDDRIAHIRSKTYTGIAKAMAKQWTDFIMNE
jgi:hypothetical protein